MLLTSGKGFIGRGGVAYEAGKPIDFPGEDVGLAHANGWYYNPAKDAKPAAAPLRVVSNLKPKA